jgi:hypothetical protein
MAEFFDQGCGCLAVQFDRKAGTVGGADRRPKTRPRLVTELSVRGVALVLRNPDAGAGVEETGGILAEK